MSSIKYEYLANVFSLVTELALAIRMNSSYAVKTVGPHTLDDVMWLSDAMHNMELIGLALREPGNEKQYIEILISSFKCYLEPKGMFSSIPLETFDRWNIDIVAAITQFESLINK